MPSDNPVAIAMLEDIQTDMKIVKMCVFGNGKPEEGLATRLLFVERFQATITRLMWLAITAAITSIIGLVVLAIVNNKACGC